MSETSAIELLTSAYTLIIQIEEISQTDIVTMTLLQIHDGKIL